MNCIIIIKYMKKVRCVFLLFFVFGIVSVSCDKKSESDFQLMNGLVHNYGDPAVDGCGWMIEVDKVLFSPINLDANFQKDSLKVILDYEVLKSKWACGWRSQGYPQIKIINIKQK